MQNLPLPTTLRIVPLLLLLLVALLTIRITGILTANPLGTACTVHFANCQSVQLLTMESCRMGLIVLALSTLTVATRC